MPDSPPPPAPAPGDATGPASSRPADRDAAGRADSGRAAADGVDIDRTGADGAGTDRADTNRASAERTDTDRADTDRTGAERQGKGLFITFEGLDGSGKSTHLQAMAAALARRGVAHVTTHEPGGTPLADAVRRIFLDPRWGRVDGGVELLLVFASRRQHLLERIEPALEGGAVVLCDRFTDSTYAYQGHGRGLSLELIDRVDEIATGRRRPDRTLLFDLPAAEARRRGHSPARKGRGADDRLDSEDVAFYERVRRGFLARSEAEPGRFRRVDSSGSRQATARQVRDALADLLGDLEADPAREVAR